MREWLVGLVGTEWADKALYLVVAAIVLLLLFSVIWVARKALGGSIGPRSKGRGPRLAVMDVTAIDPKRKLVLIRRDEVEHLLLVGGQNDVVVEAGILRIPASARVSRNDAALRSEPDMEEALRQPVARPMAPKAVPAPSRTRQPAEAGDRQGLPSQGPENRAASPLTRPVPLPAPAAVDRPAATAASAAKPQPVAGRPAEVPQVASAVRVAPQAPEPARPDEGSGSAPEPAASPRRQEAVPPDAGPSAAPDVRIEPPLLPGSPTPSAPPVSVDQDLRPASDAKAEDAEAIDARQEAPAPVATPQPAPLPRRQSISVTTPAERPQPSPMQRVAIGGGVEPARRALPLPPPPPAPQVLPMASRSMATPTYPARPDVAAVEDQAASAPAVAGGEAESRSVAPPFPAPDEAAAAASREGQAPRSVGPASESSRSKAGLMSPIIAAAQRQQEMIRARSSPVPARTVPPLLDSGGNPLPPSDPGSRDGEEETAEKRPLSVRSFATSIQTRKPSFEPTVPAPPAPTDSEPGVTAPVPGIAPAFDDGPAAGGAGGAGDLLSAELDADLAGVDPSIAGPETVKAPDPLPLPDRQPVPAVKADAKEPWALTLEEEMDRLLGDFDFETSGSKKNG